MLYHRIVFRLIAPLGYGSSDMRDVFEMWVEAKDERTAFKNATNAIGINPDETIQCYTGEAKPYERITA